MPRARGSKATKAQAKSIPSLQNCSITLATATVPTGELGGKSLATLKTEIAGKGGVYVTKVDDATHLVATDSQYQKNVTKVKNALQNGSVHIVSFDWLEESLNANNPVSETQYLLQRASATASAPTSSKKRARDSPEDDDDDNDKADTKKTKANVKKPNATTNGTTQPAKDVKTKIKPLTTNIPLDEELPHRNFQVHIDENNVIFDVTLNQSNSTANANKFYRMQLLQSTTGQWHTWTRWGRVGESGQSKMLDAPNFTGALVDFQKKFKDKTGNVWDDRHGPIKSGKYVFIERNYEESDDEDVNDASPKKAKTIKNEDEDEEPAVKSKLPLPVQNLLKIIFNQEYFNNTFAALDYDAEKMPLGKLSKTTLMRGYDILKDLVNIISAGNTSGNNQVEELSNQYLSYIPHIVRRNSRPPVLNDMAMIKKEIELLEALTDMQLANDVIKSAKKGPKGEQETVHYLDRQYEGLSMNEMSPIDANSTEFTEITNYLIKSVGSSHGTRYKVQDVFRIERQGENDRFSRSGYFNIKNTDRRLLWHGSRCTNFGGILSQGLRIAPPEAPVSGYMFGKGVYLADMSSKSANYCNSYSSGNIGLLLLCEAELGTPPLKLTGADYEAGDKAIKQGSISTWGVGMTAPRGWKDAGCVHPNLKGVIMPDVVTTAPGPTKESGAGLMYNEYIVYDVAQIKLRYLLRVQM